MNTSSAKWKAAAVVLLAGVLPVLVSMTAGSLLGNAQHVQERLHECLELAGTFIALTVAMLLWFRARSQKGIDHLLWVAAALVVMGLTDGAHSVAPFGIVWSWLRHGATLVGGLLFALVWLPVPAFIERRRNLFLAGLAAFTVAGGLLIAWRPDWFPPPFAAGGYTLAVWAANGVGGLGFVAAAVFFLRRYLRAAESEDLVFASLTLLFGTAGVLFGLSHVWAADWWVWQSFRLLAYGILIITAYHLFQAGEKQRQRLTVAVESERQRFNDALNLLPAYVVLLSKDYQVPFANRYFEERFGKSNGRRCYEYLFNLDAPCENCETYKALQTNAPHHWEWLGPDGCNYDIHDHSFIDRDGSTMILEMGIDITARKRAEGQLREQAELLELAPVAVLVRDLENRIVYWSRGAEELYGWSKQEALGKVKHELLRTRFETPLTEIEAAVTSGARWEGELVHTTREGKVMTVMSRWAAQRDSHGKAIGFLEVNADITARKQTEQELQRYMQELERSNAELQDFASIASHDLQEPLRKVLAFGEHLKEHLGSNLDEPGSDFLARMQNAAQRMSGLIEALLQYSRVTSKAQPFQTVDLQQAVCEVLVNMEERIATSHARVEFVPMPKVMADPVQVRQLLQNLVSNALKFQPPGIPPRVTIEAHCVDPAALGRPGWCEISVRDNGIGFDEKYLDRIFRPFQRLHGRNQYEGSGMGLAICRKVVARHGGTITAHSRPGEGSTFVVTLPSVPVESQARRPEWQTKTEKMAS